MQDVNLKQKNYGRNSINIDGIGGIGLQRTEDRSKHNYTVVEKYTNIRESRKRHVIIKGRNDKFTEIGRDEKKLRIKELDLRTKWRPTLAGNKAKTKIQKAVYTLYYII